MTTHQLPSQFRTGTIPVFLVGAGGNGSMLLPHLARIHKSLAALGRPDAFHVTVVDSDKVTESNLGRQAYSRADLGMHKCDIAVHRTNVFFGLSWQSDPRKFVHHQHWAPSIVITCVDNIELRKTLAKQDWSRSYWLDLGNADTTGQIVLGGCGLPTLFDKFQRLADTPEETTAPSCSVAESLARQDLFINSTLANFAGQMLWTLFRTGSLRHHGYFVNLAQGRVAPIAIPSANTPESHAASQPSPVRSNHEAPSVPVQRVLGVQRPRSRSRKRAVRQGHD